MGISYLELKAAVVALNDTDLLEEKIKYVGVKADVLTEAFLEAVENIPEEDEDELPKAVIDAYNKARY